MKAVIPEGLISIYDLTVPHAFDVQTIRKKLDGELEKLHPCFPERYAADYHVRFRTYRKNGPGIYIRAVVMDRLQLADFREKNANCLLYAGGSHLYPVFSSGILRRRLCIAGAALFAVIAVFSAIRVFKTKAEIAYMAETAVSVVPDSAAGTDSDMESDGCVPGEGSLVTGGEAGSGLTDYSPLMNFVYEQGGRISALSWDSAAGSFSLQVSGLYPEQLSDAVLAETGTNPALCPVLFGPVAYRDDVPEMQMTLSGLLPDKLQLSEMTVEPASSAVTLPAVRALILEQGGSLVSEKVSPPSLSGSVPVVAWASFAPRLQTLLGVSQLELARDEGNVTLVLSFLEDGPASCQLPFSDLTSVFLDAPGLPYAPQEEDEWEMALSQQREIGRITREDGSSVVFFHDSEGKIERRVYE